MHKAMSVKFLFTRLVFLAEMGFFDKLCPKEKLFYLTVILSADGWIVLSAV